MEKQNYYTHGFIKSPEDSRDYKIKKLVKSAVKLPEKYVNPTPLQIFDQGNTEMCVACALAQAKHIIEYHQASDKKQFSPAYSYCHRRTGDWDGEGMVTREALKNFQEYGICHYDDFPGYFTYTKGKTEYEKRKDKLDYKAFIFRISSYYRLNTMEEIKTAIYTTGFALVAYDVYDCLYYPDGDGYIDYQEETKGECLGGHQMIAVGWNERGLIVCNSWSDEYGVGFEENETEGGLIIIPYTYFPTEAWTCVDNITEKEIKTAYSKNPVSLIKRGFKWIFEKIFL